MSSLLKLLSVGAGSSDLGQWLRYFDTGVSSNFRWAAGINTEVYFGAHNVGDDVVVYKFDEDYNILWGSAISEATEDNRFGQGNYFSGLSISRIFCSPSADAVYVVGRYDDYHDGTFFIKLNGSNGSIVWQRHYYTYSNYGTTNMSWSSFNFNYNYITAAGDLGNGLPNTLVLDTNGNQNWNRTLLNSYYSAVGIDAYINRAFVLWSVNSSTPDIGSYNGSAISYINNSITFRKVIYSSRALTPVSNSLQEYNNSAIFVLQDYSTYSTNGLNMVVFRVNSSGSVLWAKTITPTTITNCYGLYVDSSGIALMLRDTGTTTGNLYVRLDFDGNFVSAKHIGGILSTDFQSAYDNAVFGGTPYDGRSSGGYYQANGSRKILNPPQDEITGAYTISDTNRSVGTTDFTNYTISNVTTGGNGSNESLSYYTNTFTTTSVNSIQGSASGYAGNVVSIP